MGDDDDDDDDDDKKSMCGGDQSQKETGEKEKRFSEADSSGFP